MLDPRGRKGLMRVCRELNEAGLTIVMITHFMEEAAHANRVIVLEGGHIALEGTPEAVLTQADALEGLSLDVPFAVEHEHGLAQARHRRRCASTATSSRDMAREDADGQLQLLRRKRCCRAPGSPTPGQRGNAAAQPVVEFRNVSFTYQPSRKRKTRRNAVKTAAAPAAWGNDPDQDWALRNISLDIRAGEFLGIAGHTGSGKSTLIQLANGLLKPTEGCVLVGGRDISDKKAAIEARRNVGVVFQYPEHQLFAATVYEDVAFGPRNLGLSPEEAEQRVREGLELVHLDFDKLRDRNPFALSGGQQRRVAFAGVLAMRPTTLVLDEPVAGLDPRARKIFLDLIAELHTVRGMTIVVVSHDMNDLARLCDRVLVLNRGEAFALDTPERVFARAADLKAIGLDIPDTLHVANVLGIPLPNGSIPTIDELADQVVELL